MTRSSASAPTALETLFATQLYRVDGLALEALLSELAACCLSAAEDDQAGRSWARQHGYAGYTSYASLGDLTWRFPAVATLMELVDPHVSAFAALQEWDLGGRKITLDSVWINVLAPGGVHGGHIHPHSVVSGTVYVEVPPDASAIRFEDPRLGLMMAQPPRRSEASRERQTFPSVAPKPGTLLLWESWLRHEVTLNRTRRERLSISFNYAWR